MNKVSLKCKTNIKAHFAPVGISRRCARLSYVAFVVLHYAGSTPPSLGAPTVVFRSAPFRRLIAAVIGSTDCRIKSHVFLSFGSVFFLFALALETKRKKMNKMGLKCKADIIKGSLALTQCLGTVTPCRQGSSPSRSGFTHLSPRLRLLSLR